MFTLEQLVPLLTTEFACTHVPVIGINEVTDPRDAEITVPAVHAFTRETAGGEIRVSTLTVYHERLPIPSSVLRSFLVRLSINPAALGLPGN